jgi:hypothetical protein
MMKQIIYLLNVMLVLTMIGCTKTGQEKDATDSRAPEPKDTIHTRQAAMNIYGYQPLQALQIIDEAVAVGNLSDWQAEMCRARIYSPVASRLCRGGHLQEQDYQSQKPPSGSADCRTCDLQEEILDRDTGAGSSS